MRDKDYAAYAPDKHGPEADARKAEAAAYIEQLRAKHGIPRSVLYPAYPDRNRLKSFTRKEG